MILVINNAGDKAFYLHFLLRYLNDKSIDHIVVSDSEELSDLITHKKSIIKGAILSGSNKMFDDLGTTDLLLNVMVLMNLECPIFGICFGAEIITKLNGGLLRRLPRKKKGSYCIESEIYGDVDVWSDHLDSIGTIPLDYKVIATGNGGMIEAIRHKVKPIIGVQFHPEALESTHFILDLFVNECFLYNIV